MRRDTETTARHLYRNDEVVKRARAICVGRAGHFHELTYLHWEREALKGEELDGSRRGLPIGFPRSGTLHIRIETVDKG